MCDACALSAQKLRQLRDFRAKKTRDVIQTLVIVHKNKNTRQIQKRTRKAILQTCGDWSLCFQFVPMSHQVRPANPRLGGGNSVWCGRKSRFTRTLQEASHFAAQRASRGSWIRCGSQCRPCLLGFGGAFRSIAQVRLEVKRNRVGTYLRV